MERGIRRGESLSRCRVNGCAVEFEERDLIARVPACVPLLAAAMAQGWRLANDGSTNHEDVIEGLAHLQDFRGAARRKLSRRITFRFVQKEILVEREKFRVEQFLQRCVDDPTFFRFAREHPRYSFWWDQLVTKLPHSTRHLKAAEADAHDRSLCIPIGCPAEMAAEFARMYEEGF